jgi:predicted permease
MFNVLKRRLGALLGRNRLERELDDEVRFHLDKEIEANRARGMSESDARAAALRAFGGVERFKEETRDARGVRVVEELWQDLRYGARMMRKAPGFTAVAVVSLALGIGANAALFGVADSVLLRKLPVKDPDRLVLFEWQAGKAFRTSGNRGYGVGGWPEGMRGSSSFHYRAYDAMRRVDGPLSDLIAFAGIWDANVVADGNADKVDGQYVSGNYFGTLGVSAVAGRTIDVSDDDPAAPPAVMLSAQYWHEHFGADPGVVGKQISVNNVSFTVVGVMPPGFTGTLQVDSTPAVIVPLAFEPALERDETSMEHDGKPGVWYLNLMGRLKPGATIDEARESLASTFQAVSLDQMPPPKRANEPAVLEPKDYPQLLALTGSLGMTETRRRYTSTIYLMFGVVVLVLLIACANVANMLLARATARGAEITVRLAVGAGRVRLVRQLLTESLLLSAMGGALGVLFAVWGATALGAMADMGDFLPSHVDYHPSVRVLLFTIAISIATGILFGIAPALRASRLDLTTAMKEGGRTSSGISRSRLGKALVVAQIAMSLVLLVGAGLFLRTVRNLQRVDVGFDQENLVVFTVQPGSEGAKEGRVARVHTQIAERVEALPGVRSVTFGHIPLLANYIHDTTVILPGETPSSETEHTTNLESVRENYFDTLGIPILRGRGFTEQDTAEAPKVIVVSESFVNKFFPGVDPIGQRVGFDEKTLGQIEIVGVARDIKYNNARNDFEPLTYTPWRQDVDKQGRMTFALRVAGGSTAALEPAIRDAVRAVDPTLPVTNVTTQVAQARKTFSSETMLADLLGFFGVLALVLAAIGLYGVMAYSVAQRTNEIGIRMALGARAIGVLKLVVWQGMKFALVGVVVGSLAALALKRVVESQLYGVGAADPLTFVVVGVGLVATAAAACFIPGRRATKVDPVVALRNE